MKIMETRSMDLNHRLMSGIFDRNLPVVTKCLEEGADVNCEDAVEVKSPLILAVERKDLGIIETLLNAGANTDFQNKTGNTPLHIAVENNCKDIVELLLKKNASTGIKNQDRKTSLDIARELHLPDILALLKSRTYRKRKASEETSGCVTKKLKFDESSDKENVSCIRSGLSMGVIQLVPGKDENQARSQFIDELKMESDGLKLNQHGSIFQLKLLMLFLWRAKECGYTKFRLATELADAEKFDDIVFQYQLQNDETKSFLRLLQAKHKEDVKDDKKHYIDEKNLLSIDDADPYALFKYFHSFVNIDRRTRENSLYNVFSKSEIEDIILITNADIREDLRKYFDLENVGVDELLKFENIRAEVCKFNYLASNPFLEKLKVIFKSTSDYNRLIGKLTDYLVNKKQLDLSEVLFKKYYYSLMNEVFEIVNQSKGVIRFQKQFASGEGLSEEVKKFRTGLINNISFIINFTPGVLECFEMKKPVDENEFQELGRMLAQHYKGEGELTMSQMGDYHAILASEIINPSTKKFFNGFINSRERGNWKLKLKMEFKKQLGDAKMSNDKLKNMQFKTCKEFGCAEFPTDEKLLKDLAKALIDAINLKKGEMLRATSRNLLHKFYLPLKTSVVNQKTRKFEEVFINGDNGANGNNTYMHYNFRDIFISEMINLGHISRSNLNCEDEIKTSKKFTENFISSNNFEFANYFVDTFCALINLKKNNIIKISEDNIYEMNECSKDYCKQFRNNLENLAGYVLIEKDKKIRFCSTFLQSNDLPENITNFKRELKKKLGEVNVEELYNNEVKVNFKKYEYKTCEEGALTRKLPSLPMEYIVEFFKKFKLVVNYPNRKQLNYLLTNEMKSSFKELDSVDYYSIFYRATNTWMADRIGQFYTPERTEALFNKIWGDIAFRELDGASEAYCASAPKDIEFKKSNENYKKFLTNKNKQVLHIISSCNYSNLNRISLLRLFKHLKTELAVAKAYGWKFGSVFVALKQLGNEKFSEKLLRCFDDDQRGNVLVIECNCLTPNDELCDRLSRILTKNRIKKIIVFGEYSKDFMSNLKFVGDLCTWDNEMFCLHDFTEESRNIILEKQITFQGMSFTVGKLLNERVNDVLNPYILNALFDDCYKITVGTPLKNSFDVCSSYIKRKAFQTEYRPTIKNAKFSDILTYNEQEFKRAREVHLGRNIHWFSEFNDDRLFLEKTHGNIKNIIKFKLENRPTEDDFIRDCKQQVVIISDHAGQGKSTFLASIGLEIKQKYPSRWVEIIKLNKHSSYLEQLTKLDKNKFKKFGACLLVLKKLLQLCQKNLKINSFKTGVLRKYLLEERMVVIMFDGFDEISPKYSELIINLIEVLVKKTGAQIWITTRPQQKKQLEKKFETIAFSLSNLGKDEQIRFLIKYWQRDRRLDSERLEKYAEALIEWCMTSSVGVMDGEFAGVPLQLLMLAEVFTNKTFKISDLADDRLDEECVVIEEGVIEYCESNSQSNPTFPKDLNFLNVYRWFIHKKYEVYTLEKCNGNAGTAILKKDIASSYPIFIENHRKLALHRIFFKKESKILLPNADKKIQSLAEKCETKGLIVLYKESYYFIHQTFAEYFVADFFVQNLMNDLKNQLHKTEFIKILLYVVFKKSEYKIIRKFINWQLKETELSNFIIQLIGNYLNPNTNLRRIIFTLCKENHEKITEIILKSLKDLKTELLVSCGTLLHKVIDHRSFDVFRVLLANGADIYVKNKDGYDVLYYSAVKGHLEGCKLLTSAENKGGKGADIFARDEHGNTLLHKVTENYSAKNKHVLEWLLEQNLDVNAQNGLGETVLHLAANKNNLNVSKMFIRRDADANISNKYGESPLFLACRYKKKNIVNEPLKLCKYLAKPKKENGGGADFNVETNYGHTLMHAAESVKNFKLQKWLAKQGLPVFVNGKYVPISAWIITIRKRLQKYAYVRRENKYVGY